LLLSSSQRWPGRGWTQARPPVHQVIGQSVQGRSIDAYTYGAGGTHLLLVGGIHGGYEWNSVLLAYAAMDWLAHEPHAMPEELAVTVIPSLNPDGLFAIVGKEGRFSAAEAKAATKRAGPGAAARGRFNARAVDLNRNFDCRWEAASLWQDRVVGAGRAPFSEPEAAALRKFVQAHPPAAAVFWHSRGNAVYASACETDALPEALLLMAAYAKASRYRASPDFDSYETTGDAEGWLASRGIPAITVELATRDDIEWSRNRNGLLALFEYFEKKAAARTTAISSR
jgi:g-D-glutamyl-meso-diaminopimelate peptidase